MAYINHWNRTTSQTKMLVFIAMVVMQVDVTYPPGQPFNPHCHICFRIAVSMADIQTDIHARIVDGGHDLGNEVWMPLQQILYMETK